MPGILCINAETLNLVKSTLDLIGSQGLWVMDKDYDSGVILEYFLRRGLDFAIRMNTGSTSRNVLVDGKSVNIVHAAQAINRRVTFDKHCRFGSLKVELRLKHITY